MGSSSAAHPTDVSTSLLSTSQYSATVAPLDAASSLPAAARLSTIAARKTRRKQAEVQCPTCNEKCLVDFTDKDAEDLPATSGNNLDAVRSYVGEQSKGVLEADVLGREMLRQIPGSRSESTSSSINASMALGAVVKKPGRNLNSCCGSVSGDRARIPSSTNVFWDPRYPLVANDPHAASPCHLSRR